MSSSQSLTQFTVSQQLVSLITTVATYIETHLERPVDYHYLSKQLGLELDVLRPLFSLTTGWSLSGYLRARRLSQAACDLINSNYRVSDLATKYQYQHHASFARAFRSFHGCLPHQLTTHSIRYLSPINPSHGRLQPLDWSYHLETRPALDLFGLSIATSNNTIHYDAPQFYQYMAGRYGSSNCNYAGISYDHSRQHCQTYSYWYTQNQTTLIPTRIPASRWLTFDIGSQSPQNIQALSREFYQYFFPYCQYHFRLMPELEYYHHDTTDFLVAIV